MGRMTKIISVIAFGLFAVTAPSPQQIAWGKEPQFSYQKENKTVGPLRVTIIRLNSGVDAATVTSLVVPTDKFHLRLVVPPGRTGTSSSLLRYLNDENRAAAAFTGGFLESYSPATPSGLIVMSGKLINALKIEDKVMTSALCFTDKISRPFTITSVKTFKPTGGSDDCIQAGPLIINSKAVASDLDQLDKRLDFQFSSGAFSRAFIGMNTRNDVILGVSTPLSLFDLRKLMLTPERDGGLGLTTAIMLSGGRTAGLAVSANPNFTTGHVETLLPNALVVEGR